MTMTVLASSLIHPSIIIKQSSPMSYTGSNLAPLFNDRTPVYQMVTATCEVAKTVGTWAKDNNVANGPSIRLPEATLTGGRLIVITANVVIAEDVGLVQRSCCLVVDIAGPITPRDRDVLQGEILLEWPQNLGFQRRSFASIDAAMSECTIKDSMATLIASTVDERIGSRSASASQ